MTGKSTIFSVLLTVWGLAAVCQSTTIGVKIGNNGNISFNNKYKSGNYTELYQFGNGYQGGVHIDQRLFSFLSIRGEATYMNSSFEMDHSSHWPGDYLGRENYFYEEIIINTSAFDFSGNLVVHLGPVSLGVGPEISMITQANGRGARYYFSDPNYDGRAQRVQYRFFANRKQVYNLENENEKFSYDANRIMYGLDMNISVLVYKAFAIQAKVFYPTNEFVESFIGINNDHINQQTVNAQLNVLYSFPLIKSGRRLPFKKKKKRR